MNRGNWTMCLQEVDKYLVITRCAAAISNRIDVLLSEYEEATSCSLQDAKSSPRPLKTYNKIKNYVSAGPQVHPERVGPDFNYTARR